MSIKDGLREIDCPEPGSFGAAPLTRVDLLQFWAKTEEGQQDSPRYHPLLFHMLDVAFTARAMWARVRSTDFRDWFERDTGLKPEDSAALIAFLAGAHDIGKASPAFQHKSPAGWDRLVRSGFQVTPPEGNEPHALVSAWCLANEGALNDLAADDDTRQRLSQVVGGHHGHIPCRADVFQLRNHKQAYGIGPWVEVRRDALEVLSRVLGVSRSSAVRRLPNAAAMSLAGLISVADWVGSDQVHFPCASDDTGVVTEDTDRYLERMEERVTRALRSLGWLGWSPRASAQSFSSLFPWIKRPNPMQLAVERAAEGCTGPSIFVIEAPMGDGKTEAAMYLTDLWTSKFGQTGAYFALPTQATSNQMFGRVTDFLDRSYPSQVVNLQLLHGLASLSGEVAALKERGARLYAPAEVNEGEEVDGAVVAAEWFTHRKRGLLAPFGVGTVDQAMFAVLQTRHVFVRLFGLAHKTVILDEVHAYDTYMTTIIENLVRWLGALESSVVLLSATLPHGKRERLLSAYAEGAGWAAPRARLDAPYPRVSWIASGSSGSLATPDPDAKTRRVTVKWIDGIAPSDREKQFPLGPLLRDALENGGCAALVCNTVRRAQDVYEALKPFFPENADDGFAELDLLHARYMFRDRQDRERRTLRRFGKPGATVEMPGGASVDVHRPYRAIVISTQVIEQSLDLDFDLLVTDLAPADLVLQRVGRLHRHSRSRPPGLGSPTVWVGCPIVGPEGVPWLDRGTWSVYDHSVLLRSWLALHDRSYIDLPGDIEDIVEAVYDEGWTTPDGLSTGFTEALASAAKEGEESRIRAENEAEERETKPPRYPGELCEISRDSLEEEDPTLHAKLIAVTRLTGPNVATVLLYGNGELAFLDPSGSVSVDLRRSAKLEDADSVQLLANSITVASPGAVGDILAETSTPSGWQKTALLRYHRPVLLDEEGVRQLQGCVLSYGSELGLVIQYSGS